MREADRNCVSAAAKRADDLHLAQAFYIGAGYRRIPSFEHGSYRMSLVGRRL
jgi:hypothetical protein